MRARLQSKLATLCARLYDSATPADERAALSFEVSMLRARISRTRDPLAAMTRASANDEEC